MAPNFIAREYVQIRIAGASGPVLSVAEVSDIEGGDDKKIKLVEAARFDGHDGSLCAIPALDLNSNQSVMRAGGMDANEIKIDLSRWRFVRLDVPPLQKSHGKVFGTITHHGKGQKLHFTNSPTLTLSALANRRTTLRVGS
jgi:hypothetical protein